MAHCHTRQQTGQSTALGGGLYSPSITTIRATGCSCLAVHGHLSLLVKRHLVLLGGARARNGVDQGGVGGPGWRLRFLILCLHLGR